MESHSRTRGKETAGTPPAESACVVEMVNATRAAAIVVVPPQVVAFVAKGKALIPMHLGRSVRRRVAEIRN